MAYSDCEAYIYNMMKRTKEHHLDILELLQIRYVDDTLDNFNEISYLGFLEDALSIEGTRGVSASSNSYFENWYLRFIGDVLSVEGIPVYWWIPVPSSTSASNCSVLLQN